MQRLVLIAGVAYSMAYTITYTQATTLLVAPFPSTLPRVGGGTGGTAFVGGAGFVGGAPLTLRPTSGCVSLSRTGALRRAPILPRCRAAPMLLQNTAVDTGDGEEWIRAMELEPMDEPVDQAAWMASESSDSFCPMEGDIVEYIADAQNSTVHMGMVVADSKNKEVLIKTLLSREGDGEYDEWRCFVARAAEVEQVPLENVRYVGSCNECVVVAEALDSLMIEKVD